MLFEPLPVLKLSLRVLHFVLPLLLFFALLLGHTASMAITTATLKSTSASRVNKTGRSAITVVESVLAGTRIPVMATFSGSVGATGQGMALMPSQNNTTGMTLPSVPALPFGDGEATKDQLLASAKTNIETQANDVATKLKAAMSTYGHKAGNFIFEQTIKPAGSLTYIKVVWHVAVLESGRVIYSEARITDPDPYYVYVVYVSKQVAAGLSSTWAYPDGGKIKWQLVKKDGTQLTAMTMLDVNGAFDAPVVPDGTTSDPDWGVKCMADITSSSTCPTLSGFADLKTLISSTSASGAIIDYTRKLAPAYIDKGDGTQQANMAISFDSRNLTHNNSCTNGTYRTQGRYGFTLQSTYDRYSYDGKTSPVLTGRSNSNSFSPTQAFDYSQATSLSASGLGNSVINPFDPTGSLVDASSITGVTYTAPVSQDGRSGQTKTYVYGNTWGFSVGDHYGNYECYTSNPIKNVWVCNGGYDSEGNCISGGVIPVQICGTHFAWGYVVGIHWASMRGIQMREYYGGYYYNNDISVTQQDVACPN